jgi:probable rRNA maturation factor
MPTSGPLQSDGSTLVTTQTPVQVFGADEQDAVAIDVLRWVQLAQSVLTAERVATDAEVSLVFVDEQAMTDLNVRYLEGTGPTDVLAFPLDEEAVPGGRFPDNGGRGPGSPDEPSDPPIVLGDVLVCPAVARRQAEEQGHPVDNEIALLVVHGVLHLLGFDHAEEADAERMRARERDLLARFANLTPAEGATDDNE